MQFSFPHKVTKTEAKSRVNNMLAQHQAEIAEQASDVKTEWKDDVLEFSFVAQGTAISGTLTVTDSEYQLYAKLPLRYKLFEGTIERMIKAEVAKLKM
jgi:hypothetical protein